MTEALAQLAAAITAAAPHANVPAWTAALTAPMRSAGITTPNRIAMFVGQVAEESGDFRALSEDLYYTTAERIAQEWPSHFASQSEAAPFICRPAALANHVYANRMGNGNEESGDGWRYGGRGLIQVTGRTLYAMFARVEPRAADPQWLLTLPGAAASACWYWALGVPSLPSLNALADGWDVTAVTRRINGGLDGLDVRVQLCEAALRAFDLASKPPPGFELDLRAQTIVPDEADELDTIYNPKE